jgi:D-3-phosphoglycerate dehydrogenase
MDRFRVALSGDFRRPDGTPTFPSFDLAPLTDDPQIAVKWVDAADGVIPAAELEDCDALILLIPRFTAASIPESGRLGVVARFGVGYDHVDVPACSAAGIGVVITPDGVRRPVAVSVLTYVLALSQKLMVKDRLCRMGPEGWAQRGEHMGEGLVGRTLGQLGLGNIGAEVVKLAAPFGMRLIAHDPFASAGLARELGVELVSSDELFRRSDFLSVSVPLNAETRHYVNAERLRLMKPGAYLVNTSRGPVVDQRALHRALVEGTIAGAGLAVIEVEPCPTDEPILALPNVIVTPHSLCWTDECFAGNGAADVAAVKAVMRGAEPRVLVDRGVTAHPAWMARLQANEGRHA